MLAIAALAIVAVFGKSAVMFVSAAAIAVIVYVFRRARMRDRVVGIVVAGLGGSIGAEIVHTLYHYASVAEPGTGGDSAGFFMSALLVGVMNAAVIAVAVATLRGHKSKHCGLRRQRQSARRSAIEICG